MHGDPSEHYEHHEHEVSHEDHEQLDTSPETNNQADRIKKTIEQHENDPLLQSIGALRAKAEREAKSSIDYDDLDEDSKPAQAFMMHRDLKNDSYRRTLQKTRRQLNPVDRTFSKFIHQPIVETASSTAANTIGRPLGLFVGSLFALLGSSFLLYMSKRYGFTYNYAVFLLCFAGGFTLGLLVELGWRAVRRKH